VSVNWIRAIVVGWCALAIGGLAADARGNDLGERSVQFVAEPSAAHGDRRQSETGSASRHADEAGPVAPADLDVGGPRVWFSVGGYEVRDDDLWIVGTGVLCSVACGVLGCFLVLRRMSLLGDAISHAILPGLALAFLVTHSREPIAMLAGALAVGVATAYLSTALSRWGRVPEDAAMGVVFTTLFAIGVVMITWVARDVDLDPGCVLYGLIEFTPFDTVQVAGFAIPRAFAWLLVVLAINVALIWMFFKELRIVCFDPYLATTMGISATLVHYGLMTSVAATAVASFESVGSILVVAMLVAPGATAHLLTDKLSRMLWLAAAVGALSGVLGYILAVWIDTSVAGMIATVSLGLFIVATLASPRYGFISKLVRRFSLAMRITEEDTLGMLYRWHERSGDPGAGPLRPLTAGDVVEGTRSGALGRIALWWLMRRGLVRADASGALAATPVGIARAVRIGLGHHVWESFLAKHLGIPLERVHARAHRAEHFLSDRMQAGLDEDVVTETDPHGRPIPPRG